LPFIRITHDAIAPVPTDTDFMNIALGLARTGLGEVWPNPAVGCVIVAGEDGVGRIVGRGRTQKGGRPHAETVALAEAGDAARGATAYVTLEPCSHHGQTGPCADALIAAGIARVVSALEDPDPKVSGRGHARLAEAGVRVDIGCAAEAAAEINRGFFSRVRRGRPLVQLKLAVSENWKIAARPGVRTQITGAEAGREVQRMRAEADAILVGQGTWTADDPLLTVRYATASHRAPVRIILDARAELPLQTNLARTAREAPVWAIVAEGVEIGRCVLLENAGIRVIETAAAGGRIDLAALLTRLGDEGLTRLLVEGGGKVAESLLRARLADEIHLFTAPIGLPEGGVPAFGDLDPEAALAGFALASERKVGADTLRIWGKES